jgi:SAM-dependent methyltransferase
MAPRTRERGDGDGREHVVEVSCSETADQARFLHVFQIGDPSAELSNRCTLGQGENGQLELQVTTETRVLRLLLSPDMARAGEIEIADTTGQLIQPRRLLPSGILPHGPEGVRLIERWDAPYRGSRAPGWDVGRPSRYLVQAVTDGAVQPGRAIVLGCGTGTNAIYLASQGFDVTAVDVAPTALSLARDKARKAAVTVRWVLADVLALPRLEPFDLVFDRGCYHHIRRYDAPGYVETTRRLSHTGTRVLILGSRYTGSNRGGPPPIKEEEIRDDFSKLFEILWLREIHFDRPDASAEGPPAWSVLLRRRPE